jgi:hypothetical protein
MSEPDDEYWDQRDQMHAELLRRFQSELTAKRGADSTSPDIPPKLYHYTRLGGLQGILKDKEFWASDVRFMNDASELSYATELIDEEVQKFRSQPGNLRLFEPFDASRRLADPFDFGGLDMGPTPYIACFCEKGDLLSQWRGYGPSDSVSLEVDVKTVAAASEPDVRMLKVIYDQDIQRGLINETIDAWIRTAQDFIDDLCDPSDLLQFGASWALEQAMLDYHLRFKHPTFEEEQEWRFVKLVNTPAEIRRMGSKSSGRTFRLPLFDIYPANDVDIRFRPSDFGFTPYVGLDAKDVAGGSSGRVRITGVRQGPRAHADIALESLKLYMRSEGYDAEHTAVDKTGVPLRR